MRQTVRKVSAIVVGCLVALVVGAVIQTAGAMMFPLPGEGATADPSMLVAATNALPFPAKLGAVVSWLIAGYAGVWLCLRIGDWSLGGWIVSAVYAAAAIAGEVGVADPVWMQGCAVILPLLGGWLAQRAHRKPYPGEPLLG